MPDSARFALTHEKDKKTTFAERLKMAMQTNHIKTQAQLAKKLKVSRQTVNSWFRRKTPSIDIDNLYRLADMLQCNARWLYFGPPNSPYKILVDEQTAIVHDIAKALPPDVREQWIEQGRIYVRLATHKRVTPP